MKKLLFALICTCSLNAQNISDLKHCGTYTGFSEFDLTLKKLEILNGLSETEYAIKYYETVEDAQQGINAILNPQSYSNNVPYTQKIYVKVSSVNNSFIKYFNIVAPPSPINGGIYVEYVDNFNDTNDNLVAIPYDVLAEQVIARNPDLNLQIKFFRDVALTDELIPPFLVYDSTTCYYVATNLATGCMSASAIIIKVINSSLGIKENTISSTVVYPNPANSVLNIQSDSLIDHVTFVNYLGQEVLEKNVNQQQIDISSLETGIYLATIFSNGSYKTIKVVKQ